MDAATVEEPDAPPPSKPQARDVLLAIITVVLVSAALKLAKSVFLPLVFAGFLIGVLWPVYDWLRARLPRAVATLLALLVFLAFLGLIGGGVWYSAEVLAQRSDEYGRRLASTVSAAQDWLRARGLPTVDASGIRSVVPSALKAIGEDAGKLLTGFVLAVAYLALGLLEVRGYGERMGARGGRLHRVARRVAHDLQKYLLVRTMIGLLTGAAVAVGALLVGLEFPFVWGMLNFLLNYVPTVGSILGVIPPVLFALVQFGDPGMVLLVLSIVGGIQLLMGNYVDPLVQGKYMVLSPLVVLFSVTFWGFLWGAVGALIAVPLTVLTVLICREFDSTRFIALILSRDASAAQPHGTQDRHTAHA